MKKLLALALVALMAGAAFADAPELGLFNSMTDFSGPNANLGPGGPYMAYIVFFPMGNVDSVGGYEVGITIPPTVFVLAATGPNGWTNFGSNVNQICGFGFPVPVVAEGTVLCTMTVLNSGVDEDVVVFHASDPASIPGHDGPVCADGANPDLLIACSLVTGPPPGVVATINGNGVVAVENHTLTNVKSLFQ